MANYHLEFETISRKKGKSPVRAANYQSGERLYDEYYGRTYYNRNRGDILYTEIILPEYAPSEFYNRQTLWSAVDRVEKRSDARTARRVIGSLPNELILDDNVQLVREYVTENFISIGMCADLAIHEIINTNDPSRNNVHVHILLSDRPLDKNGFCANKNRDWNKKIYIKQWRESWAEIQNSAYIRLHHDVRVTDKSYIDRDIYNREPKRYLGRGDMFLERNGICTVRGDENREIELHNKNYERNLPIKERDRAHYRGR